MVRSSPGLTGDRERSTRIHTVYFMILHLNVVGFMLLIIRTCFEQLPYIGGTYVVPWAFQVFVAGRVCVHAASVPTPFLEDS